MPELRRCRKCGYVKTVEEFQPSNLPMLKAKGILLNTCKLCWRSVTASASSEARAVKTRQSEVLAGFAAKGYLVDRIAPDALLPGDGVLLGTDMYIFQGVWAKADDRVRVRLQNPDGKSVLRTLRYNKLYDRVIFQQQVPPPPVVLPPVPTTVVGLSLAGLRDEAARVAIDTILSRHRDEHDDVFTQTYRTLLAQRLSNVTVDAS